MAAYMSTGEAHRRIGDYPSRVADAISCSDGTALASLLAVSSAQASTPLTDALAAFPDFPRLAADRFPNLSDPFVPLLRTIHSHSLQRYADAYYSFEKAANAFLQEFRNWESPWAMHTVALEIRLLADKADREPTASGKNPDKLQAAGSYLMKVFGALAYADVVTSLKRDLRLLRQTLDRHEDQFLKSGVYLVLEKLELQVYQRLVKKIHIIQRQKEPAKAHQIKLDVVVKALKWLEIDMDVDEVECIMACLIYRNLIKGYFAHKSKVLVLSKRPLPETEREACLVTES